MKAGSIVCLGLFIVLMSTALLQMWFQIMPASIFIRVIVSMVAMLLITFAIVLVRREYLEEDQLKKDHYLG